MFGSDVDGSSLSHQTTQSATSHRASDDLLQLAANPFASPTGAPVIPAMPSQANSWATGPSHQNGFGAGGGGGQFASDNSFANAFGASANGSTNGKLRELALHLLICDHLKTDHRSVAVSSLSSCDCAVLSFQLIIIIFFIIIPFVGFFTELKYFSTNTIVVVRCVLC